MEPSSTQDREDSDNEVFMLNFCEDSEDFPAPFQIKWEEHIKPEATYNNEFDYIETDAYSENALDAFPKTELPNTDDNYILGPQAPEISNMLDNVMNKRDNPERTNSSRAGLESDIIILDSDSDEVKENLSLIVISNIKSVNENISPNGKTEESCPNISEKFETKEEDNKPSNMNHNITMFACDQCEYSTKIRFALQRHLESHSSTETGGNNNKCKITQSIKTVKSPSVYKHTEPKAEKRNTFICFKCSHCPFTSKTQFALNRHIFSAHKNIKKNEHSMNSKKVSIKIKAFKCKYCLFTFTDKNSLNLHQLTHKQNKKYGSIKFDKNKKSGNLVRKKKAVSNTIIVKDTSTKIFRCKFCSYTSISKQNCESHLRQHTFYNRPILRCSFCSYKSTVHSLNYHISTVHKKEPLNKSLSISKPFAVGSVLSKTGRKPGKCSKNKCASDSSLDSKETKLNNSNYRKMRMKLFLKCKYCDFKTIKRTNLIFHTKDQHRNKINLKYKCKDCKYQTTSRFCLASHCRISHQVNLYCDNCQFQTYSELKFTNHKRCCFKKEHSVTMDLNAVENCEYKCEICDFRTNHKHNLLSHKNIHSNFLTEKKLSLVQKNIDKEACEKSKDLNGRLDKTRPSRKTVPRSSAIKSESKQFFKCTYCDYKTIKRTSLTFHMKDHQDKTLNLKYKCKMCKYQTPSQFAVAAHYKTSHRFILRCNNCQLQTYSELELTNHKRWCFRKEDGVAMDPNAAENVEYKCDICDFKTNHKHNLQSHQIVHINIKELKVYKNRTYNMDSCTTTTHKKNKDRSNSTHKCQLCNFVSNSQFGLRIHSKVHRKSYKCNMCPYICFSPGYLQIHKNVKHFKRMGFSCNLCNFSSDSLPNLLLHIESPEHRNKDEIKRSLQDSEETSQKILCSSTGTEKNDCSFYGNESKIIQKALESSIDSTNSSKNICITSANVYSQKSESKTSNEKRERNTHPQTKKKKSYKRNKDEIERSLQDSEETSQNILCSSTGTEKNYCSFYGNESKIIQKAFESSMDSTNSSKNICITSTNVYSQKSESKTSKEKRERDTHHQTKKKKSDKRNNSSGKVNNKSEPLASKTSEVRLGNKDKINKLLFGCKKCEYVTDIRFKLKRHVAKNHSIGSTHLQSHINQTPTKKKLFKCTDCFFESKYKSIVNKHYNKCHVKQ